MPAGAPTYYREEYDDQAFKLCLMGATDKDLANFFDVCEATINNWKEAHPKFLASIRRGKDEADMAVAKSLYDQALGYHYTETTETATDFGPQTYTNHRFAQKDFRAARFWLMNRQPEKWREKVETQHSGQVGITWNETKTYPDAPESEANPGA